MEANEELMDAITGMNDQLDDIRSDVNTKFSLLINKVEQVIDFLGIPIDDAQPSPHYLMQFAWPHKRGELSRLLHQLDIFRDMNVRQETNCYTFDLLHYSKAQVFSVWRDIRVCLNMKQKALVDYIIQNTNLGTNNNTIRRYL